MPSNYKKFNLILYLIRIFYHSFASLKLFTGIYNIFKYVSIYVFCITYDLSDNIGIHFLRCLIVLKNTVAKISND